MWQPHPPEGPVTPSALCPLLASASVSADANVLRGVENQLKALEVRPGFYSSLLALGGDESLSVGVRLQSVLYLKNGIDRYWRRTANNAIPEEEKSEIRRSLLRSYVEPVYPIALQMAVIVGKVARLDVPREWPELFPLLRSGIQQQQQGGDPSVQLHRSLLLLYHVVKVLASKRLGHDRRAFHDLSEQLLPFLLPLWRHHHGRVSSAAACTSEELEVSILVLKNLRYLTIQGLRKPHENQDCLGLLRSILGSANAVLAMRKEKGSEPVQAALLEKYAVLEMKVFGDLLQHHPYSFLPVMAECLQLVCWVCFTPEGNALAFRRLAIFSLNILKLVLSCPEYKPSKLGPENALVAGAQAEKLRFFVPSTVLEIGRKMMRLYIPLLPEDLLLWDTDPEQYACEEGGDAWRYSYRPCCESLFLLLFHEFRETLAPFLIEELRECAGGVAAPDDMPAILRKDAVYNAVGLAAFELFDEVDFDGWLSGGIRRELSVEATNYRIVRRRLVWAIGQWSGVKLSPSNRPVLYELLLPALRSEEDLVVRLSAAKALKIVMDDFEFCPEEVKPHLGTMFERLFQLLKEVEECDTKLSVLNVLSYLIERVDVGIRDVCEGLVHYLPHLWDASAEHNMLRCSILATLVAVVQSLGTASQSIAPFVYSVVKISTDPDDEHSVYLLEDGLELWLAALHNSKSAQQWTDLAQGIPRLLELGDCLRSVVYIIQAYILLTPHDFISGCGEAICRAINAQYCDLQDEGTLLVLRLVDLVLKAGPPDAPWIFASLILWSYRAVHGGTDYPMLMSLHLSIVSRIIVSYPNASGGFTSRLATDVQQTEEEAQARLLDVWLDKMPTVTQRERRKLLAMALSSIMCPTSRIVEERVFGILQNLAEALSDVMKPEDDSHVDSLLFTSHQEEDDTDYYTEHDQRKRDISLNDVVFRFGLNEFIQSKMSAWKDFIGMQAYADVMTNLDAETMGVLKEYITL